jgi:thioredoxin 1
MIEITNEADFKREVTDSEIPVLVDFWADWCGPCKLLAPTIAKLGQQYEKKAKIVKINADVSFDLLSQFKVNALPCILFFQKGLEVKRLFGLQSASTLESELNNIVSWNTTK